MKETLMNTKIKAQHLGRRAVVYLRQSSEKQVKENRESQRLQYALVDRARDLGFKKVELIDSDLGLSAGLGAGRREGFDRLIASVAVGEVGIVLSREVSRLSRTDKDWCRLLEVCQLFGTLIADADNIYDLGLMDDQLILGSKGTLSVVELNVLRMRLLAGMEEKARRGEMIRLLPPGYVCDGTGKVVKDPDRRVQEAMEMEFHKFCQIRSVRQTFLWFHGQGVELPVNKSVGEKREVVWQLPTYGFVKDVLQNPFYAGAYVWGRRPQEKIFEGGKLRRRQGRYRKPEECRVFIPEHHEGYIDWESFEENNRLIRANSLVNTQDESVGAVRAGQGLLSGLLRCGQCGRKLHVRYWGKSGTAARYLGKGDFHLGGKYCLAFGGSTVDRRFGEELVRVVSPLGVRASLEAMARHRSQRDERCRALRLQLEQMDYEAKRAFEQYNEVDPRNRLVAEELERRWNEKLEKVESLKAALAEEEKEAVVLTEEEEEEIIELGERFGEVWASELCPAQVKKKIIRTAVEEVTADLDEERNVLSLTIHWKGGCHTRFEMAKPVSGVGRKTSLDDLEVIRGMAVHYSDAEIARVLTKLGRRTGKGNRWNEQRVKTIRLRYGLKGEKGPTPERDVLTLGAAAKYCQVSQTTIKRLVASGVLKKEQVVPWAPWEIRRSDLDSEKVKEILECLRETGKLVIGGDDSEAQESLFIDIK
ncbi:MAG: recombinase family protein [Candidatus Aminicenantales bacterium]